MLTTFRKRLAALAAGLMLSVVPLSIPVVVSAADADINSNLGCGANLSVDLDSCDSDTSGGTDKINDIVVLIINIFSIVVGIVAVIMIIVGGFKYITSGGDSGNITSAKNTIIYALIGLVVVALAQFLVQFVLNKVTG